MGFKATIPPEQLYSWESQVCQYPYKGEPGVSYMEGPIGGGRIVHCLLFRNERGHVRGILNYFDDQFIDGEWQKPGDVNIWIHPKSHGQGIGTALWKEAVRRWNVRLETQDKMTPAGAKFAEALMREGINGIQD